MWTEIFKFLPLGDLATVSRICKQWKIVFDSDALWRNKSHTFQNLSFSELQKDFDRYEDRDHTWKSYFRNLIVSSSKILLTLSKSFSWTKIKQLDKPWAASNELDFIKID